MPGLVLGQASLDVPRRPADVMAGVLVGAVKMQQIDRAGLPGPAGQGVTPAARATAVAIDRAFAAPMIDKR